MVWVRLLEVRFLLEEKLAKSPFYSQLTWVTLPTALVNHPFPMWDMWLFPWRLSFTNGGARGVVSTNVHQLFRTRPLDPSCVEADITRRAKPRQGGSGGFVQLEVGQLSHKLNEMIWGNWGRIWFIIETLKLKKCGFSLLCICWRWWQGSRIFVTHPTYIDA